MEVWRQNEKFFDEAEDNQELVSQVAFIAADLGAEAEMDAQGRITFPPELRRELGLEDQTLRLYSFRGRIEVLSEKLYEEQRQGSTAVTTQAVRSLKGLK